MQFEVGKLYRTRNSNKVTLIYDRRRSAYDGFYPLIFINDEDGGLFTTTNEGKYQFNAVADFDIVSEWREPIEGWINIYKNEKGPIYNTKKECDDAYEMHKLFCPTLERIACVKVIEAKE